MQSAECSNTWGLRSDMTHWQLHMLTHLCFHIQTRRSCVLSQFHSILDHLWAKTVFSKEGQGPGRAAHQAWSLCSWSRQESLWHQRVTVLHVLRAARAHLLITGSRQPFSPRQKFSFRGAFIAAPRRMVSSLHHDPCVRAVPVSARASISKQGQRRGGAERRKREATESHGRQKKINWSCEGKKGEIHGWHWGYLLPTLSRLHNASTV